MTILDDDDDDDDDHDGYVMIKIVIKYTSLDYDTSRC